MVRTSSHFWMILLVALVSYLPLEDSPVKGQLSDFQPQPSTCLAGAVWKEVHRGG